jgi:WD40 repeat protein
MLRLPALFVVLMSVHTSLEGACTLTKAAINLGGYSANLNTDTTMSTRGSRFAQVTTDNLAIFWKMNEPSSAWQTRFADSQLGQRFLRSEFSRNDSYAFLDSRLPSSASSKGMLELLDMRDGERILAFNTSQVREGFGSTYAFSSSERYFAIVSQDAKRFELYDAVERRYLTKITTRGCAISALAVHPNERVIATKEYCHGNITLWDIKTHKPILELASDVDLSDRGNLSPFPALMFSKDGALLATHSTTQMQVNIWDVYKKVAFFEEDAWLEFLPFGFSPNNAWVFVANMIGDISVLNASDSSTLNVLTPFGPFVLSSVAVFSPDSKMIVVSSMNGDMAVYSTDTFEELCSFDGDGDGLSQIVFTDSRSFYGVSLSGVLSSWKILSEVTL